MPDDRPMLAKQRQEWILRHLQEDGAVRVAELTALLQVSDMTIRRDLDVLARRGLVDKVHGGATLHDQPTSDEPGFERKSSQQLTEKSAIAAAAMALIPAGGAIALSAGTTTFALAQQLIDVPHLTIVTNSRRIAEMFDSDRTDHHTVILTGGVRTPSDALVGPLAERAIASLHVDVLFIGCHGMDLTAGLTTPNLAESETNRKFIEAARKVVVVADHTKWKVVGLSAFGELREVDVLVTDDGLPAEASAALKDVVGDVIVCESAHEAQAPRQLRRHPGKSA